MDGFELGVNVGSPENDGIELGSPDGGVDIEGEWLSCKVGFKDRLGS